MKISLRNLKRAWKTLKGRGTGRRNIHLLHLRKTGGTALKSVFAEHGETAEFSIHTHPHRYGLADVPKGHAIMFVTRDPVKRFISGFESRLRKGAPANHVPWTPEEERAFNVFEDANSLALALDPSHQLYAEAAAAMAGIKHINSSYWDWFRDENLLAEREKDIVFIGRTEALDSDFTALAKYLGLPAGVSLPTDPKKGHRSNPAKGAERVFEKRAEELVKNWYLRDYEFMDLCANWRERNSGPVITS